MQQYEAPDKRLSELLSSSSQHLGTNSRAAHAGETQACAEAAAAQVVHLEATLQAGLFQLLTRKPQPAEQAVMVPEVPARLLLGCTIPSRYGFMHW